MLLLQINSRVKSSLNVSEFQSPLLETSEVLFNSTQLFTNFMLILSNSILKLSMPERIKY